MQQHVIEEYPPPSILFLSWCGSCSLCKMICKVTCSQTHLSCQQPWAGTHTYYAKYTAGVPKAFQGVNHARAAPYLTLHVDTILVIQSLIVNEYLEDAFPSPSLLPPTPLGRAQTRLLVDQFGVKVRCKGALHGAAL